MNPKIPAEYHETGRWLAGFVRTHAKREDPRIEILLDEAGSREGRSFGLRLVLEDRLVPPLGALPLELDYHDVAAGRTQFAWCAAFAERIRALARALGAVARSAS